MTNIKHQKIAVLATNGFEQMELTEPVKALRAEGATVTIVSLKPGAIQGMNHHEKGNMTKVDLELAKARGEDFDALVLPGGVANPDTLRTDKNAIAFIDHFVKAHKPIAAICHGPATLIEANAVRGKKLTSWPSLKTDLTNAGAEWVDRAVVVDGNLVTSRKPDDLKDFNREMLALIASQDALGPSEMTSHPSETNGRREKLPRDLLG
jgi:protease I